MFGRYVTTVASFIVLVLLAAVQPAFAWQAPDELPVAPRLIVNDHVQDTEAKPEETPTLRAVDEPADDSLPEVTTSSRRPAPAIVPVEEIIASPVPREETSRRAQPSDDRFDQAIGAGLKPPTAAVPAGGDEANGQPLAKLKATTFKGVQPGATTLEQLTAAWGSPLSESRTDGATLMTYSVDPFPHIDVELQDNVVQSLTIRFKAATSAKQAIEQLGLADLPPAELSDAAGRATGLSFPERGVALLYSQPNSGDRVAEIRLQPIGVDPFLSRVRGDRKHQWQRSLDDLQIAAQLNPADARIWWIKSEVLIHQSEFAKAALAIEKALVIQPDSQLYRLTAARLIAEAGSYDDAIAAAEEVYRGAGEQPLLKARAALLLADLATLTGERDFARAMELSQHAIGTVLPLANAEEQQRRVAAKRILIDAHLEIAGIVAQGEWQQKEKSVQQWLDRAKALADDFVQNEAGDSGVYFDVLCKRLDAYAWLEGAVDPASTVKELQLRKANLTGGSTDPTYQRHVQWQYAKAMIDAVDIQRAREEKTAALDYGKIADEIVTKHAGGSWNREVIQFQRSRLYFLLGSIQAVQFRDHAAAVKWFDKSIDDISRPEPDRDLALTVRRGQWMVSMGISYWHVGRKSTGLKLTEAGLALIVNSHDDEPADAKLLSAPYNNLAFMHGQLGDEAKSKHYAAMANRLNVETQR